MDAAVSLYRLPPLSRSCLGAAADAGVGSAGVIWFFVPHHCALQGAAWSHCYRRIAIRSLWTMPKVSGDGLKKQRLDPSTWDHAQVHPHRHGAEGFQQAPESSESHGRKTTWHT
jgi:hypothetical protein